MEWQEWVAGGAATLVAGVVEETTRRSIKGKAGALAGGLAAAAVWPKVRDEVRRWLNGGWGAVKAAA